MFRFLILAALITPNFAMGSYDTGGAPQSTTAESGDWAKAVNDSGGEADGNAVPSRSFWRKFQFHGTLSQGFIYGSGNNYLTMDSNSGSGRWSEGAVNLGVAITDNIRVGVQVHSYIMGEIGRGNVKIDWAFADYRVKEWLGFRGGKLKAPMGLFGEIEDTDTLYNWALLPQSMYEAEYRSFNVPVVGGGLYGNIRLPIGGTVAYQFFGGQRGVTSNDGAPLLSWQLYGIAQGRASGYTYGGDIKWRTPVHGLRAGVSFDNSRQYLPHAYWGPEFNPYGIPIYLAIDSAVSREIYSVEFQHKRLYLVAEGKHEPHWVENNGAPMGTSPRNAWYVMGTYRVTDKLTTGSYFSRVVGTGFISTFSWQFYNPANPAYYGSDTVANVRYDFNRFLYGKLEGHYIDGELGPFFPGDNPNGSQKVTRLIVARIGFTW
jgi:hypothetical protein